MNRAIDLSWLLAMCLACVSLLMLCIGPNQLLCWFCSFEYVIELIKNCWYDLW